MLLNAIETPSRVATRADRGLAATGIETLLIISV